MSFISASAERPTAEAISLPYSSHRSARVDVAPGLDPSGAGTATPRGLGAGFGSSSRIARPSKRIVGGRAVGALRDAEIASLWCEWLLECEWPLDISALGREAPPKEPDGLECPLPDDRSQLGETAPDPNEMEGDEPDEPALDAPLLDEPGLDTAASPFAITARIFATEFFRARFAASCTTYARICFIC